MRALVIGGNGFIGSHLVEGLRAAGHGVRVLDAGRARSDVDWAGVDYRQAPYTDPDAIGAALSDVDTVFHLASTTVPATSNADPIHDVSTNLIATLSLLAAMERHAVRRIVFFSSGGTVYGDPEYLPVDELHPLRPISSYGIVKATIERYLLMHQHFGRLDPLILRPSNPYGPRQSAAGGQGFIAAALARLREDRPLQIWGDGETVRDYIYIGDLVDLVVAAAASGDTGIVNAGSGDGHSLNAVCASMERVVGRRMSIEYLEGRRFDVRAIVLDTTRAQTRFGWRPSVDLETGIGRTWAWMQASEQSIHRGNI
ncbi:MAG: NAD-dependent epimerase/dehydratase family protein [Lysobacteraceae bacterium]|nr:MAG: NAD-dependent epimerase/dehydratase family protein [Xanthomonadaceae bacterium]